MFSVFSGVGCVALTATDGYFPPHSFASMRGGRVNRVSSLQGLRIAKKIDKCAMQRVCGGVVLSDLALRQFRLLPRCRRMVHPVSATHPQAQGRTKSAQGPAVRLREEPLPLTEVNNKRLYGCNV